MIQKAHNNVIRNNIFFTNSQKLAIANGFNSTYCYNNTIDNNLFCSSDGKTNIDGMSMDNHAHTGDPLFVNAQSGDCRLAEGSPAIDACSVSELKISGEKDLYGDVRLSGTAIDIGACEYGSGSGVKQKIVNKSGYGKKYMRCLTLNAQESSVLVKSAEGNIEARYRIDGRTVRSNACK